MPINVVCSNPACGRSLRVKDELGGKKVRCPSCQSVITVPEQAAFPEQPQQAAASETKLCPYCGETIHALAKKCRYCNELLDGPLRPGTPPSATSGLAIASLVLGVLSIFGSCLTAIPAIILGIVSLSKIRRSQGALRGSGMAIAGICTGTLFTLLILPALLLPALARAREEARKTECKSNLRQLGVACAMYANDYDEWNPPDLSLLYDRYASDRTAYKCPSDDAPRDIGGGLSSSYRYVGCLSRLTPHDVVIAYDKPENHRLGVNALFYDGHVEWTAQSQLEGILAESYGKLHEEDKGRPEIAAFYAPPDPLE